MVQDAPDTDEGPSSADLEDVIASSDAEPGGLIGWLNTRLPQSFGRTAVLTVAAVAAALGLLVGYVTAVPPTTDPVAVASIPPAPESTATSRPPDARVALLTIGQLAAIDESASGGTYTRGSTSAIPNPCLQPHAGDTGVSYVPGPAGATAVSFQLAIGTVTQRVTPLADDVVAQVRLREVLAEQRACEIDAGLAVVLGEIGPGLGDEFISGSVVRNYPTGGSSTTSIVLVRLGASLVEFSLTGPTSTAADVEARCVAIAQAALRR